MLRSVEFPERYKHIYAVWLFRRSVDGRCDICGARASYEVDAVLEDGESKLTRCDRCFMKLLEYRRILLIEEGYWRYILCKGFHGLRVNRKPSDELPEQVEESHQVFLRCDLCGVRFASESDLRSHIEARHEAGGELE